MAVQTIYTGEDIGKVKCGEYHVILWDSTTYLARLKDRQWSFIDGTGWEEPFPEGQTIKEVRTIAHLPTLPSKEDS